jgi:hypothetical protein
MLQFGLQDAGKIIEVEDLDIRAGCSKPRAKRRRLECQTPDRSEIAVARLSGGILGNIRHHDLDTGLRICATKLAVRPTSFAIRASPQSGWSVMHCHIASSIGLWRFPGGEDAAPFPGAGAPFGGFGIRRGPREKSLARPSGDLLSLPSLGALARLSPTSDGNLAGSPGSELGSSGAGFLAVFLGFCEFRAG